MCYPRSSPMTRLHRLPPVEAALCFPKLSGQGGGLLFPLPLVPLNCFCLWVAPPPVRTAPTLHCHTGDRRSRLGSRLSTETRTYIKPFLKCGHWREKLIMTEKGIWGTPLVENLNHFCKLTLSVSIRKNSALSHPHPPSGDPSLPVYIQGGTLQIPLPLPTPAVTAGGIKEHCDSLPPDNPSLALEGKFSPNQFGFK